MTPAILIIFLRFYYFSCDFYCQAWEFWTALSPAQSSQDNQIGHNLNPAVLQSEKLQFQNWKILKMEAGTNSKHRQSEWFGSSKRGRRPWRTGRGVILNWTEWFSVIINERRFLIESPEIFLRSDLIRVTVGDVGREAATAGAGFRSVIPRSLENQSRPKFGRFSLEKVTDNWELITALCLMIAGHEAVRRQRHN